MTKRKTIAAPKTWVSNWLRTAERHVDVLVEREFCDAVTRTTVTDPDSQIRFVFLRHCSLLLFCFGQSLKWMDFFWGRKAFLCGLTGSS